MTVLTENQLHFDFTGAEAAEKFDDDQQYPPIDGWKKVDFLVHAGNEVWLIEVKDPDATPPAYRNNQKLLRQFSGSEFFESLMHKGRDSFLRITLARMANENYRFIYVVILAYSALPPQVMISLTDYLKRTICIHGPKGAPWAGKYIEDVRLFNLEEWNVAYPQFPVSRIS